MSQYATLAELKARLGITDTSDDTILTDILDAVSRWIDQYTGRRFDRGTADETRYYTAMAPDLVVLDDDLGSVTSLTTDEDGDGTYEVTWSSSDYWLEPRNIDSTLEPYTRIRANPNGNYVFPTGRYAVKVAGRFGYSSAAPDPVHEACLLQSSRLFRRRDTPLGIVGTMESRQTFAVGSLDTDVAALLRPFRRMVVGAV